MRFLLIFLSSIVTVSIGTSQLETYVSDGKYVHALKPNSEGIRRALDADTDTNGFRWQFFYFCDLPKNKKKCGAWVDAKGTKIKGANNRVKKTKEGAVITGMTDKETGTYSVEPEDPNDQWERFRVFVQGPPPPPPPKH